MLPKLLAERLSERLATVLGLHFPPERHIDLEQRISWAMREAGRDDVEAFALELLNGPFSERHIGQLAPHLTVSETYFFRDARLFEALEREVLPALIARRAGSGRTLRILSAGCCTGEEAYSLAILLDRLLPRQEEWDITIMGSDVNERSLARARLGQYRAWSFRGTPPHMLAPYVRELSRGRYQISDEIRSRVRFLPFNLVDEASPLPATGGFDLILCRNVLMYFTADAARRAVATLHALLAPDGLLVTSPVDGSRELFDSFSPLSIGQITFYRPIRQGAAEAGGVLPGGQRLEPTIEGTPPTAGDAPLEGRKPRKISPSPARRAARPPGDGRMQPHSPRHATSRQTSSGQTANGRTRRTREGVRPEEKAAASGQDSIRAARRAADEGRLDEAAELCRNAMARDKTNASYRYLLAVIELERDRPAEALRALTQAAFLDPMNALPHVAMGNLRQAQSRHREADRHFATAAKLLRELPAHAPVPDGEGLTVGRLLEMVEAARASLEAGSVV